MLWWIANEAPESLPFGGLNGPVDDFVNFNGTIYFGGQFTGTANQSSITGLSNVAAFDIGSNTWAPLGQGLNGNVTNVVLHAIPTGVSSNETVVVCFGTVYSDFRVSPGERFRIRNLDSFSEQLGRASRCWGTIYIWVCNC